MKNPFRDYLYFHRAERNGIIVLIGLSFLLFLLPDLVSFQKAENIDLSPFLSEIKEWESQMARKSPETANSQQNKFKTNVHGLFHVDPNTADTSQLRQLGINNFATQNILKYRNKGGRFSSAEDLRKIYGLSQEEWQRIQPYIRIRKPEVGYEKSVHNTTDQEIINKKLFPFDPNKAGKNELLQLGLSEKVVNTLLKFRKKGGSFRKKEDLSRIFGLGNTQYLELRDYIILPENERDTSFQFLQRQKMIATETVILDINKAALSDWQKLKGIGPYYAGRIVSFRDKLGGFHSIGQVGETYRLPDSTFQKIKSSLKASPVFRKIKINTCNAQQLKNHPYFSWKQANLIVNYRKNHGSFTTMKEFYDIKALSPDWIQKIAPYLSFE